MATFEAVMQDVDEYERDHADGAALRKLREALPDRPRRIVIGLRAQNRKTTRPLYIDDGSGRLRYGHTIAEAADKCREALA